MDTAAEEWFSNCLPAGFAFCPTDQALVAHYLSGKLRGDSLEGGRMPLLDVLIPTVDLYGDGAYPWRVCQQLAYPYGVGTTEFYCLTPRRRKYGGGGSNPDRTVGSGTWAANGHDEGIYHQGTLIGHKTHLTFKIRPPGSNAGQIINKSELVNTHWVMHEYRLQRPGFEEMVLCRVRNQRKEKEEENRRWSPPWWEQQELACDSAGSGCGGKKRNLGRLCEDVAVPPAQKQRRGLGLGGRDSKSEGRESATPPRDPIICMDSSTLRRLQPAVTLVAVALPLSTSAAASHQGLLYPATPSVDTCEDFSPFSGELYIGLLGSSQEGTYYPEAPCRISNSTPSAVLPLDQQQQGILCSVPTDGYCSPTLHAAPVLGEPSAPVLTEPSLWDAHLQNTLHLGDSDESHYRSTGMIISPSEEVTSPEAGSIITSYEDMLTWPPLDDLCWNAYGHISSSSGCSISNTELLHYEDFMSDAADQLCESQLFPGWEQLTHQLAKEEEEEEFGMIISSSDHQFISQYDTPS